MEIYLCSPALLPKYFSFRYTNYNLSVKFYFFAVSYLFQERCICIFVYTSKIGIISKKTTAVSFKHSINLTGKKLHVTVFQSSKWGAVSYVHQSCNIDWAKEKHYSESWEAVLCWLSWPWLWPWHLAVKLID